MVWPADGFAKLGSSALHPGSHVPMLAWFDVRPFKGPEQKLGFLARLSGKKPANPGYGAVTRGLLPFFGREIEASPNPANDPNFLLNTIRDLALYLFKAGPVVKDGDTVGGVFEVVARGVPVGLGSHTT